MIFARKCFLPWYDVHTSDQVVKIASTALPEGMLVCNLNSSQIKEYFAILLDQLELVHIEYIIIVSFVKTLSLHIVVQTVMMRRVLASSS